ncbi:hypothetical protein SAMN04489712_103309 [Thermomonospora echinospora]|uniref:Uncharacterized protein n=1 Tax=Thermomonospora echinospora TaxID=1992 RepID=A0A1H5XLG0_9ACTN|nr:hypothetical protein [Thermomonospora echinospora]SEG12614.1 hypothetical protein SAMN04489712_103309 [Thermomonospora echinospora]
MFLIIAAVALIALVSSLVYLVEFARASRRDSLFAPADRGGVRRARRVTGMYVRGGQEQLTHH